MKIKVENPYKVPPFDGKNKQPIERFFWWSWHPLYPYWSKSCWGGVTERQAHDVLKKDIAAGMKVYHNKLIREDENDALIEVFDLPCQRLDIWRIIFEQENKS